MQNEVVPESDSAGDDAQRFTATERVVLAFTALIMTAWMTTLVWAGYKLVELVV